jgi:hypothetical protein
MAAHLWAFGIFWRLHTGVNFIKDMDKLTGQLNAGLEIRY